MVFGAVDMTNHDSVCEEARDCGGSLVARLAAKNVEFLSMISALRAAFIQWSGCLFSNSLSIDQYCSTCRPRMDNSCRPPKSHLLFLCQGAP